MFTLDLHGADITKNTGFRAAPVKKKKIKYI